MDSNLIAVKVSVEGRADQRMNLDSFAFDQLWLESLDTETMQRRRAVKQHRTILDYFFKDFPDFRLLTLDNSLGTLDVAGVVVVNQLADDERTVQFKGHRAWQSALMQLELWPDDDY